MSASDSSARAPQKAAPDRVRALIRALQILGFLAFALGVATVRVIVSGEKEITLSTAALRAKDPHEAIVHARRAAAFYAPGAPHVRVAYARLIALATAAEGLGQTETALFAWNAVRGSALETRWLVTPHEEDLVRANLAIASLMSKQPGPLGTRADPPSVLEQRLLDDLTRDEAPRVPWIAALVFAFAAWASGAFLMARKAVSPTGRVLWDKAKWYAALIALGAAVWVLAYFQA